MRFFPLSLLPGLLVLAGCEQPAAPAENFPGQLAAAAPIEVFRIDDSHTFIDCNGDEILVHNTAQIVTFFRGTPEHGHLQFHEIQINSTATNLTTGVVQTFHGADNFSVNGDFTADETPGELTRVVHQTFTAPGTQATHVVLRFHITINQNGVVTADHFESNIEC